MFFSYFFNVVTRTFKLTYVTVTIFLLYSVLLNISRYYPSAVHIRSPHHFPSPWLQSYPTGLCPWFFASELQIHPLHFCLVDTSKMLKKKQLFPLPGGLNPVPLSWHIKIFAIICFNVSRLPYPLSPSYHRIQLLKAIHASVFVHGFLCLK